MVLFLFTFFGVAKMKMNSESYYFSRTFDGSFEEITEKVKNSLKVNGFGVITEVNMHEKLKEKLDVDMNKYLMLGVCNPKLANEALQIEENIGVFLPCKVLIKEINEGKTEVVSIDPSTTMSMIGNKQLNEIADEATAKLRKSIDGIK